MTDKKEDAQAAAGAAGEAPAKRPPIWKRSKRFPVVVGVVAAVLVVAGAGFWTWHETPSFCGAICHTPMDAYLQTYTEGTTDKYGNELEGSQKTAMMAYLHGGMDATGAQVAQGSGMGCLSCHEPVLTEQVSEGISWIGGNYEVLGKNSAGYTVLESRTFDQLTAASGKANEEFCLKSGCHVTANGEVLERRDLIAVTDDMGPRNPHSTQHGEIDCGECHKGHTVSVNYCTRCHDDAQSPDGWATWGEAEQLYSLK